jgi:hypothetical protein
MIIKLAQYYFSNKALILLSCLIMCANNLHAQYWQQQVDYDIKVKLIDSTHLLIGDCNITYYNNSPDTLRFIYVHLYPNAYRTDKTAYAKQQVENGNTSHYFSAIKDRSNLKEYSFNVNGTSALHSEFNGNGDIVIVDLPEPLLPKQQCIITTPFTTYVGKEFSRMGRIGNAYHCTQWFPKVAVYDNEGWHALPYLDQGEFYSDFGKYDVRISVPNNYVVAATGILQTQEELIFLNQRRAMATALAKGDSSLLQQRTAATGYKTLHFTADSVVDFAWFADTKWIIESDSTTVNNNKIYGHIYYRPENYKEWHNGARVITHTIDYYSNKVGAYPYASASAVDGANSKSNGMEYPMITYMSGSRDSVENNGTIIHEVGHNWFMGILASNERAHAFLDEGCNTYYDDKCMDSYASKYWNEVPLPRSLYALRPDILQAMHKNQSQAILLNSSAMTENNYYGQCYEKWNLILQQLEQHLGTSLFDSCMHYYYQQNKFKHPRPADIRNAFEFVSKQNLSWAFDHQLKSTELNDFKIKSCKATTNQLIVHLSNKASVSLPTALLIEQKNNASRLIALPPFSGDTVVELVAGEVQKVMIDPRYLAFDINRKNNIYYPTKGLNKRGAPQFTLGSGKFINENAKVYFMPFPTYNYYDGIGLGVALHNLSTITPKLQYVLAPYFALNSKMLNGLGALKYTLHPTNSKVAEFNIGSQFTKFQFDGTSQNISKQIFATVQRLSTTAEVILKPKNLRVPKYLSFSLRHILLNQNSFDYKLNADSTYSALLAPFTMNHFVRLQSKYVSKTTFNPYNAVVNIEANKDFIKAGAQLNFQLDYYKPKQALHGRIYAGKYFALNSNALYNTSTALAGTHTAENDYTFDNYMIARSSFALATNAQISNAEGGMKINTYKLSKPVGSANNYLVALNLASDIPIRLPLKIMPFVDACYAVNQYPNQKAIGDFLYTAGFQVFAWRKRIVLNIPLIYSTAYSDYLKTTSKKGQRFLNALSFTINLSEFNTNNAARQIKWGY